MTILDMRGNPLEPAELGGELSESAEAFLIERLARLEDAIIGWELLSGEGPHDFSREGLRRIAQKSREFYLANPMIKQALYLQRFYTFGQGVTVKAKDEVVNDVVQAFWDDPKNQRELTGHQAMGEQDTRLSLDGNLFLAFFTNRLTGRVQVRTIPFAEIDAIISDPDDRATPWFYKRVWTERATDLGSGREETRQREAYYPDWQYQPAERIAAIGGKPVIWDTPVYHVPVNRLPDMQFGVSEVYAAIDWARAYKDSLEDDATRSRGLARFIWRLTVKGGQKRVSAAKSKLGTRFNPVEGQDETNPPPAAGSVAITTPGQELEPVRVAGATLNPDHNRSLRLFAATALGLPETFFGDANVGNHATAQTLDRPTELKFGDRQELWRSVFDGVLRYVIEQNALAPMGVLRGRTVDDPLDPDGRRIEIDRDPHVDVDFPSILERDLVAYVGAIIDAATLKGQQPAGTLDLETLRRMLLVALREHDIDELMDQIRRNLAANPVTPQPEEEPSPLMSAVRRLSEAAEALREERDGR